MLYLLKQIIDWTNITEEIKKQKVIWKSVWIEKKIKFERL